MTEKQINKWLRRQFSAIGWVLIGFYFLTNLIVSIAMGADLGRQMLWNLMTGNALLDFDWDAVLNNGWGYTASCAVLMLILWAWKGSSFWGSVWSHRNQKMTGFTLFTVLGMCMAAQLLNGFWIGLMELLANAFGTSMVPLLESVSGASGSFSMFFYGSIAAPLAEELLFRGFVLHSLKPYGKRFAVWGSAILFGAFHGNLLQTPYAFVMGLVLGWLAMEYSLGWAVGLHIFNNLILAEGMSYVTAALPPLVADGIILAVLSVFSMASGAILIAKRREIRAYRRGEWMDRRCVWCFLTSFGVLLLLFLMVGSMISFFFT